MLLIDGHSMAFRAFFALPLDGGRFRTKSGQPTNAVYGFLSMFANIIAEEKPTHAAVACAWRAMFVSASRSTVTAGLADASTTGRTASHART